MSADDSTPGYEGWTILELLGHRRLAGHLSESTIAGASLLRIDIPGEPAATDVINLIEEANCAKGCKRAGRPAQITAAMTPSGICPVMVEVIMERPVPEIDPRPDGPVCNAREPIGGEG